MLQAFHFGTRVCQIDNKNDDYNESQLRKQSKSLYRQKILLTGMTWLVGIQQSDKTLFQSWEKIQTEKIIPPL